MKDQYSQVFTDNKESFCLLSLFVNIDIGALLILKSQFYSDLVMSEEKPCVQHQRPMV